VSAFTRIAKESIHERGIITRPDLVVVADASLIGNPAARVLEGIDERTAVFVNSPLSAEQVGTQTSVPGRLTTLDLTDIALQQFGQRGAISALLGAVACRLVGLRQESLHNAISRELADAGLTDSIIEHNQVAARRCYETVPMVAIEAGARQPSAPVPLRTPTYESPTRGTASITVGPNSAIRSMSGWRTFRPVLRPDLCNGCWLCFASCPEGAITIKPDGTPAIYYPHCKGCLDCVEVCPTDALTVERETEAVDKT
jgi:pyruvate ferredoxin oxidoreductase gamma subunit